MAGMSTPKRVLLWVLGIAMVLAGADHFIAPEFYLAIMPPYLPYHAEMVFISGVAEVVLGLAVLLPRTRVLAAWGLIALFIAIFPANIHQAVNDIPVYGQTEGLGILAWLRLPIQFLLIAWAGWYTRPEPS